MKFRLWMPLFLAAALLFSGCLFDRNGDGKVVVACLGDSNTDSYPYGRWCGYLADAHPEITFIDYAKNGAKAYSSIATDPPDGFEQLRRAAEGTQGPPADYVIFAFLTNDIGGAPGSITPDEALTRVSNLRDAADALDIASFVATVPPRFNAFNNPSSCAENGAMPVITATNELIRATFPSKEVVDFDHGFSCETHYFGDGVHINPTGQNLRFKRANSALILR